MNQSSSDCMHVLNKNESIILTRKGHLDRVVQIRSSCEVSAYLIRSPDLRKLLLLLRTLNILPKIGRISTLGGMSVRLLLQTKASSHLPCRIHSAFITLVQCSKDLTRRLIKENTMAIMTIHGGNLTQSLFILCLQQNLLVLITFAH